MTARIGIDCRLAGKKHAGIGRYIAEFVPRIVKQTEVDWVLFFRNQAQFAELYPEGKLPPNINLVLADVRHYSIAEQRQLSEIFSEAKLDLLHVPHFNVPMIYNGKTVVTIHDLLWHQHRGARVTTLNPVQYWVKYWFYKQVSKRAVIHAQHILVPSQVIADTVVAYYPQVANKLTITYEGVSSKLLKFALQQKVTTKKHKQLLYVGSLYPHKNVEIILAALQQLPNYSLKVVSSRSVFTDQFLKQVNKLGLNRQVEFLGGISDKQLAAEYAATHALVQPSKSEGFGLTGIEAMSFGTPVLASDIPIFHEIYNKAAIYFHPEKAEQLVAAVQQLEDQAAYKKLAKLAVGNAAKYDWQQLVDQTWAVYKQALEN